MPRTISTVTRSIDFDQLSVVKQSHILLGFIMAELFDQVYEIKPNLLDIGACITLSEQFGFKKQFLAKYQSYLQFTCKKFNQR